MAANPLSLEPASIAELVNELGKNLESGGCFVAGATGLAANDACELTIVHPKTRARLVLAARVVWVSPGPRAGVGLAFEGFSPTMREKIRDFVGAADEPDERHTQEQEQDAPQNLHERLRGLSLNEQLRMAREGDPHERIVLERLYGKAVWIALLANPRLTIPEVLRMARMGNMPLPQLDTIAGNATWLANAQVRRALLQNSRLPFELARKVLAAMPKPELRLVPTQTAYSMQIRAEAKRLLARS